MTYESLTWSIKLGNAYREVKFRNTDHIGGGGGVGGGGVGGGGPLLSSCICIEFKYLVRVALTKLCQLGLTNMDIIVM